MALQLFERKLINGTNEYIIPIRVDGYISATELCRASGKKFNDWNRSESAKTLVEALSRSAGIPADQLISIQKDGYHAGSFIHPKLAVHLAIWCSPEFALQVSDWVIDLLTIGKVAINQNQLIFYISNLNFYY